MQGHAIPVIDDPNGTKRLGHFSDFRPLGSIRGYPWQVISSIIPAVEETLSSSRFVSQAMLLYTVASTLLTAATCLWHAHAQADNSTENANDHWCGTWAGSPTPADVPTGQQLPPIDYTRRFFVEPQLQRTPFAPVVATEPKVQIPKIWGNSTPHLSLSLSLSLSSSTSIAFLGKR